MKKGTLFGIGVGPGDPEMITVKAMNILKKIDVIFTASSNKNNFSIAYDIAKDYIPENTKAIDIPFPMTRDKNIRQKACMENLKLIEKEINKGKNAAFLTIGDPLIYSTFGYLLDLIKSDFPDIPVEIIPGITSFQMAASRVKKVLVQDNESLLLTSGTKGKEYIENINEYIENIVILKAYRNIKSLCQTLVNNDFSNDSTVVNKCGKPGEEIFDINELGEKQLDYWTLILAKKDQAQ